MDSPFPPAKKIKTNHMKDTNYCSFKLRHAVQVSLKDKIKH